MKDILATLKGTIFGLAVGDALGVPYEFRTREELADSDLHEMRGYGTHRQPPGTWSDDTSLTLCLLESLVVGFDYEDMADRFLDWLDNAHLTATGVTFDVGNATRTALRNFREGSESTLSGEMDEHSNGNGSLMRIAPLAYFLMNHEVADRRTTTFKVSAITHGHSRSKIACWLYVEILIGLLRGKTKVVAIDEAALMVTNWVDAQGSPESKYFIRCRSSIADLQEDEIGSSGYVIHTLEASLWSFLRTETYEDAVVCAVALGEDTDTTAAVTGAMAGTFYGLDAIPSAWLSSLQKRDLIESLCLAFAQTRSSP